LLLSLLLSEAGCSFSLVVALETIESDGVVALQAMPILLRMIHLDEVGSGVLSLSS
jgi:hypothetical protein